PKTPKPHYYMNVTITLNEIEIFHTSLSTLNTLMTPSPPPIANMSPELLKSTVKTALLKSLIYAHGLNNVFPSNTLTSLLSLPPDLIQFSSSLSNLTANTLLL